MSQPMVGPRRWCLPLFLQPPRLRPLLKTREFGLLKLPRHAALRARYAAGGVDVHRVVARMVPDGLCVAVARLLPNGYVAVAPRTDHWCVWTQCAIALERGRDHCAHRIFGGVLVFPRVLLRFGAKEETTRLWHLHRCPHCLVHHPRMNKEPNQALLPTPMADTSAACAPAAPATVAADL